MTDEEDRGTAENPLQVEIQGKVQTNGVKAARRGKHWIAVAYIILVISTSIGFYAIYRNTQHLKKVDAINGAQIARLCSDEHFLANFWDGVRKSTEISLADPTLKPSIRKSFEQFVIELRKGSAAARRTCP